MESWYKIWSLFIKKGVHMFVCEYCKIEFEDKRHKSRKYCSAGCAGKGIYEKHKDKILETSFKKGHKPFAQKEDRKLLYGSDNPAYIHGKYAGRYKKRYRRMAFSNLPEECLICKSINILHVHHIDEDVSNNSINNICILCQKCHGLLHYYAHLHSATYNPYNFKTDSITSSVKLRKRFKESLIKQNVV